MIWTGYVSGLELDHTFTHWEICCKSVMSQVTEEASLTSQGLWINLLSEMKVPGPHPQDQAGPKTP